MSHNNQHIIYTAKDIAAYLSGKLSTKEMYAIEKQALQDPFLADAIDGFTSADSNTTNHHLKNIENLILKKENTQNNKVIVPFVKKTNNKIWMGVAVCILVIVTCVLVISINNLNKKEEAIASKVVDIEKPKTQNQQINTPDNKKNSNTSFNKQKGLLPPTNTIDRTNNFKTTESKQEFVKADNESIQTEQNVFKDEAKENKSSIKENEVVNAETLRQNDLKNQKKVDDVAVAKIESKNNNVQITSEKLNAYNFNQKINNNNSNSVVGRVINSQNEPVGFAKIQLNNTRQYAIANADGFFNIAPATVKDSLIEINVNAFGYQSQQVVISNDFSNTNVIKLENDNAALNDVVVSSYNNANKGTAKKKIYKC